MLLSTVELEMLLGSFAWLEVEAESWLTHDKIILHCTSKLQIGSGEFFFLQEVCILGYSLGVSVLKVLRDASMLVRKLMILFPNRFAFQAASFLSLGCACHLFLSMILWLATERSKIMRVFHAVGLGSQSEVLLEHRNL